MHSQFTIIVDRQRFQRHLPLQWISRIVTKIERKEIINAQHLKLKSQNYSKWYASTSTFHFKTEPTENISSQIERWKCWRRNVVTHTHTHNGETWIELYMFNDRPEMKFIFFFPFFVDFPVLFISWNLKVLLEWHKVAQVAEERRDFSIKCIWFVPIVERNIRKGYR